jgi:hypothetical protein
MFHFTFFFFGDHWLIVIGNGKQPKRIQLMRDYAGWNLLGIRSQNTNFVGSHEYGYH